MRASEELYLLVRRQNQHEDHDPKIHSFPLGRMHGFLGRMGLVQANELSFSPRELVFRASELARVADWDMLASKENGPQRSWWRYSCMLVKRNHIVNDVRKSHEDCMPLTGSLFRQGYHEV